MKKLDKSCESYSKLVYNDLRCSMNADYYDTSVSVETADPNLTSISMYLKWHSYLILNFYK